MRFSLKGLAQPNLGGWRAVGEWSCPGAVLPAPQRMVVGSLLL